MEEKEDRIQQMFKQIELKNMEAQRYKTAAEVAKRSAEESDSLRDALAQRDEELVMLRKENDKLKHDVGNLESINNEGSMAMVNLEEETAAKLDRLQQAMDERDREMEEANKVDEDDDEDEEKPLADEKRELQRIHESQIEEISKSHKAEIEEIKAQHQEEIKKLLKEVKQHQDEKEAQLQKSCEEALRASEYTMQRHPLQRQMSYREDSALSISLSRQPSFSIVPAPLSHTPGSRMSYRPHTTELKSYINSPRSENKSHETDKQVFEDSVKLEEKEEQERARIAHKEKVKKAQKDKEVNDTAVQDIDGNAEIATVETVPTLVKKNKNLDPVFEEIEFDDAFDLRDEEAWRSEEHSLNSSHITISYAVFCLKKKKKKKINKKQK